MLHIYVYIKMANKNHYGLYCPFFMVFMVFVCYFFPFAVNSVLLSCGLHVKSKPTHVNSFV